MLVHEKVIADWERRVDLRKLGPTVRARVFLALGDRVADFLCRVVRAARGLRARDDLGASERPDLDERLEDPAHAICGDPELSSHRANLDVLILKDLVEAVAHRLDVVTRSDTLTVQGLEGG